jgi:RecA/RadA recombinase
MPEVYFSTGSGLLDLVVGGGQGYGYPSGKICNIVGDKSSGKTFLACEIVAAAFHAFGERLRWQYDDAESGFTFNTKELYGFEIMPADEKERIKSRTVEEFDYNYNKFLSSLKKDQLGIYILDSLDGLSSRDNKERAKKRQKAIEDGTKLKGSYQMEAAKFLSQDFFKNITEDTEKKNVLLIIISQVRDKIGALFPTQVRAGGKALDFYVHTALWLASLAKIKKKDRAVGVIVKAFTKKSKTPRPFRDCLITLLFDYGLDDIGTNIDFLFDLRTPEGKLREKSAIRWSDSNRDLTVKELRLFLEENGKMDLYKEFKKGTSSSGKSIILAFIEEDAALKARFENEFGIEMSRKDLIDWIEQNNKEQELIEKVRDKWEQIEEEIRSMRKKKYPSK